MHKILRAGLLSCAVFSLTLTSDLAWADTPTSAPPEADAKPAGDNASNFIHCDGKPNKESSLGLAARIVALSLVVGLLIPPPETPDATKRLKGQDGIKACDAALNGDEKASDGGRRLELILGRAIHRMEIKDWQGAIDDIHSLPKDQPELTSTAAYSQSLGQTADYLEAIALASKGDVDGASGQGYKIGKESPYDPFSLTLAARLVLLKDGDTPEKRQLLDQAARLNPVMIITRAAVRASAGDFAGAADDHLAYADLITSIPNQASQNMRALAAIGYRLAGKPEQAEAEFKAAEAEADMTAGKHTELQAGYTEISDFYAIVVALDGGQAMRARNMFSAHSRWRSVSYGYVAEVARRLQSVGTPEEQAASPIETPQQVRDDFEKLLVAAVTSTGDKGDQYWNYFIAAYSPAAYGHYTSNVWNSKNSPYIAKKPNKDWNSQFINTQPYGVGVPCAYALYMHLAVVAKAQGKKGFMIIPGQRSICAALFRIGNPDDKDMVAPFMMDADQVIADLQTYFPKPADD